jgi:hypothetical protein
MDGSLVVASCGKIGFAKVLRRSARGFDLAAGINIKANHPCIEPREQAFVNFRATSMTPPYLHILESEFHNVMRYYFHLMGTNTFVM